MAQPQPHHTALNLRGVELAGLDRIEEALRCFDDALALKPGDLDVRVNRANVLALLGRWDAAEDEFRAVLRRTPRDAASLNGLGNCLKMRGAAEEARKSYARAAAADPRNADAWNNIGEVEKHLGHWYEALLAYDRALGLAPRHRDALYGRALVRLALGKWSGGFSDYRARPAIQDPAGLTREPLPSDLSGRRIHVRLDQGLGDEIFFLRFLPALRARGAWVAYNSDPRLAPILARADIADQIGPPNDAVDHCIAVGDLPHVLGFAERDVPPSIGLSGLPERIAQVRTALAAFGPPPYLGVAWRAGTPNERKALFKEIDRTALARVLGRSRATVIAVQRRPQAGEVAAFAAALGRPVLDLSTANDDLETILALTGVLDDYVCVSNTNVHLRAAQGRRSRVLVPHPAEFRWMAEGDSPWFPGTVVYRQDAGGDWTAALDRLAGDLG